MKKIIPFMAFLALLAACQPDDLTPPEEVAAPTGVRVYYVDQTSITFTWTKVEGADYYVGRLETADGDLIPSGQKSVKEPVITYEGLTAGTEYAFKVRAASGDVNSPYSETLSVATLAEGEEPQPPVGPDPGTDPGTDPGSDPGSDPGTDPGTDPGDGPAPTPVPNDYYAQFKIPAHEDAHAKALAFPGAEGGGMYTTGGRGGKVIHVTTLADSGTGSLRAALNESGPRTIVFDVAGLIDLKSQLDIARGDVTIAGQTAPGDGICIKGFATQVKTDNVIIRFVRFRMGDEKNQESDAIWGRYNRNIILDHCSMSWSVDECSSFYANINFTMQWCILTESLRKSVHGKGTHGYGGIWGGRNASFHHNLLANHDSRNPRIDHPQIYGDHVTTHRGNVDYRNNAVYNWGSNSTYGGENGWFNIVNNYYKPGPASSDKKYFVDAYASYIKDATVYADRYPELYLSGNVHVKHQDITASNDAAAIYWHNGASYANYQALISTPHKITGPSSQAVYTTTHVAADAFARICDQAGASLSRDAVDERACGDAKSGTATFTDGGNGSKNGLIDSQTAVGGWPAYSADSSELAAVKDSDGDGMPDWFEDQFGLNKSDASDGNAKTLDSYFRYTNLEMYLHYLVRDIVEAQNEGGVYEKIS